MGPRQAWKQAGQAGAQEPHIPISICPARLRIGIAGEGGLVTPLSALTSHLSSEDKPAPDQHCGTARLTAAAARPAEFNQDSGFSLAPRWKPRLEPEGFLLRQEVLRPEPPRLTPHRGSQGSPRGCGGCPASRCPAMETGAGEGQLRAPNPGSLPVPPSSSPTSPTIWVSLTLSTGARTPAP